MFPGARATPPRTRTSLRAQYARTAQSGWRRDHTEGLIGEVTGHGVDDLRDRGDLKTIQERLGYVDAAMTLNVYGHLIKER